MKKLRDVEEKHPWIRN